MALSFEEIQTLLREKIQGLVPQADKGSVWPNVAKTTKSSVVYSMGDKLYKASYSVKGEEVEMGTPVEVKIKYTAVAESCSLDEASVDLEANVIKGVTLIEAGLSANRRLYPAEVLKRDGVTVFENAKVHSGHYKDNDLASKSDPRNLVGTVKNVSFQESTSKLKGDLHYFSDYAPQLAKAKEAVDRGDRDLLGLSIKASGKGRMSRKDGKVIQVIEALTPSHNTAVDFVVEPAAGGRIYESINQEASETLMDWENMTLDELKEARPDLYKQILESQTPQDKVEKPEEKPEDKSIKVEPEGPAPITEAKVVETVQSQVKLLECKLTLSESLSAANLPKEMADKIRASFEGKIFEAEELDKDIKFFKDFAAQAHTTAVTSNKRVVVVQESADKLALALDHLFDPSVDLQGVKPLDGIREAYVQYTGDFDVTGRVKLSESFASDSFPNALANSMTKKLLADYKQTSYGWEKFCSTGSVKDFRTQDRVRIGYLTDLDDIDPEKNDYSEIPTYEDEKVQFSLIQKGNTLTVTRKALINDDVNALGKTINRLGRAAARTLARRVYTSRLHANSTYNITRGSTAGSENFFASRTYNTNLGAEVFSREAIMWTMTTMETFTEPGSNEKIGLECIPGNMVLIVPSNLKWEAYSINQHSPTEDEPNLLYHFFGANNEDILVSPLLTDTNDWYLAFKKDVVDWMEVDFLNGRQEPEFFLADNPIVGDTFYADKMVYKIRHEYEVVFMDPIGCYKHVVA